MSIVAGLHLTGRPSRRGKATGLSSTRRTSVLSVGCPSGGLVVVDTAYGFRLGRVVGYANSEDELKEKGCNRKVLKQVVGVVNTSAYSARRRLQLDYEKADLELRHWIQKNGLDDVYSILADMSIEFKGRLYQRNALKQEVEQDEQ